MAMHVKLVWLFDSINAGTIVLIIPESVTFSILFTIFCTTLNRIIFLELGAHGLIVHYNMLHLTGDCKQYKCWIPGFHYSHL